MNRIDDILEQLKGQQPMIDDPDALTDRIMDSLEPHPQPLSEGRGEADKPTARTVRLWRWLSIAASILFIIGIGTTLMRRQDVDPEVKSLIAKVEPASVIANEKTTVPQIEKPAVPQVEETVSKGEGMNTVRTASKPQPVTHHLSDIRHQTSNFTHQTSDITHQQVADPNLHYAAYELTKDTMPYQDPARVDSFIAKLAANYNVKQGELKCTQSAGSNVASCVYVFPDTKEIDLFSRLLQVACWYSDETPGYLLNFSHQQFFFELKDMRKQLKYRWIAERINGKILFYGTHAPLDTKESSACYQEYRDELMHTKSINHKTKEI